MAKKVQLFLKNGDEVLIDAHLIADNRANYYAKNDKDTTYQEEYDYTMSDDYEITDWLFNQMDWYELPYTYITHPKNMRDIEIEEYEVITQ